MNEKTKLTDRWIRFNLIGFSFSTEFYLHPIQIGATLSFFNDQAFLSIELPGCKLEFRLYYTFKKES